MRGKLIFKSEDGKRRIGLPVGANATPEQIEARAQQSAASLSQTWGSAVTVTFEPAPEGEAETGQAVVLDLGNLSSQAEG